MKKTKVLYVAGWGRSGSTILGTTLGQVQNYFLAGELRQIYGRGLIHNQRCGCSLPFNECPVWQKILLEVYGTSEGISPEKVFRTRDFKLRDRHLLLLNRARIDRLIEPNRQEWVANIRKLYRGIETVSGARVIIDTSKFPSYLYLLTQIADLDVRVLHLFRDPRASAYSWSRRPRARITPRQGVAESTWKWIHLNLATERVVTMTGVDYLKIRYEDFVSNPENWMKRISNFLEEDYSPVKFSEDGTVRLQPTHAFHGNPSRLHHGAVKLQEDNEWRACLPLHEKLFISGISAPWIKRYGYPLWAVFTAPLNC